MNDAVTIPARPPSSTTALTRATRADIATATAIMETATGGVTTDAAEGSIIFRL